MLKSPERIYKRYQNLQSYVGWTGDDELRVRALAPFVQSYLPEFHCG